MEINELEKTIWQTSKRLRKSMQFHDCMHLVLGLVFLRFITDTFEERVSDSSTTEIKEDCSSADQQEKYFTYNEFFVPKIAQWTFLQSNAKFGEIGVLLDDVIEALEKLNENIRGMLPKTYADPNVDKTALGELIQIIANIGFNKNLTERKRLLVKVFEYLLSKFARRGNIGSQAYTNQNIAQLLVEMVEPRKGVVYDGSCGAGDMFIETVRHVRKYRGKTDNLFFFGEDRSEAIIKIARMNLMINDLSGNFCAGETSSEDREEEIKANFILSSPFFTSSENEGAISSDSSVAFLDKCVSKLTPDGVAGIVLPKSILDSNSAEHRKMRQKLVEAKLVDCIVTLPQQLFANDETPACLLILTKNKTNNKYTNGGDEVLFIDSKKMNVSGDKLHKKLSDEAILLISRTYHRWRNINGDYIDRKGFCKAVAIQQISRKKYDLQPSRYISTRRLRKVIPALVVGLGALLLFLNFRNNSVSVNPSSNDTSIGTEAKMAKDSMRHPNLYKTVKRKLKEKSIKEKDNSGTEAAQNQSVADEQRRIRSIVSKQKDGVHNNYKVISRAYFYNKPDESTRRKAFINHWNNSYADIEAEDDKNGFIYVKFTNHLNETSRGWLRKSDLVEANQ